MTSPLGSRRGAFHDVTVPAAEAIPAGDRPVLVHLEALDGIYRALCALLYNFVPLSGHPGGSISSGRIVSALLYDAMDYDLADPDREDADILSYAAGHKALGLYAMWALRDEMARIAAPDLLPPTAARRLRLEDLLGFRRNPISATPLFRRLGSKALDGHPTPATPFIRIATGASGVGLGASVGLALAARDHYGEAAPRVHVIEGEGGLTPGRVAEAMAAASAASLSNLVLHVDWNQASIDSDRVCREDGVPGDYVQWNPMELAWLHDWNVIAVGDGFEWAQILAAQRLAARLDSGQPTAIVYRTLKGWGYGIEGKASHGAGHPLCSEGFQTAASRLARTAGGGLPRCDPDAPRCEAGRRAAELEACFWEALLLLRADLAAHPGLTDALTGRLRAARRRLDAAGRRPRASAANVRAIDAALAGGLPPEPAGLRPAPGQKTTLRDQLGRVLNHWNRASGGGLLIAAADLLGSTSVARGAAGFPQGYFNAGSNPGARLLSLGGICEDGMAAVLSGISAFGRHIGVGSSYAAFNAPLGHIAARLHAIGCLARAGAGEDQGTGEGRPPRAAPPRPFVLVCAHAGLKTGEDGPTHADPQALQLLQENFPPGAMITLTPWDPAEIWWLMAAALRAAPAVIAPFVTRPAETIVDREGLGLAPPEASVEGVYRLIPGATGRDGTLVLQESGVVGAFVETTLPLLRREGLDLDVYVVTSAELFDALPEARREEIFPEARGRDAMGITGFTQATLYRWVLSAHGRRHTLHPFRHGRFPGSGQAGMVLREAGLDGASQLEAIRSYVAARRACAPAPAAV